MKFYGREKQCKDLHRLFSHEGMQIGLVYGRRRVGKSELIKQRLRETDKIIYKYGTAFSVKKVDVVVE